MENVAQGSGLPSLLQISFCHVFLQRLLPYNDPESLIECNVFLFRDGDSFMFYLLGTEIVKDRKAWHAISPWNRRVRRDLVTEKQPWHLLLLAKSICKWNFNPCTGKYIPDFDGAPVMCPRHRIIHVLSHYTWLHSCGSGRISTVLATGKFRKHPKVIWLSLCTLRTYCKQGKAFSRCFPRWTYLIFTAVQSRGLYLRK